MRLEIIIPNSAYHETVEEIHLNNDLDDAAIQKLFIPELLAELDTAATEAKAGQSHTRKQVDEFLAENKAAWLANRPS